MTYPPVENWPQFLTAALLVMVRLSSLFVFTPVLSSVAIAPRIKAGFVFAITVLLAPAVTAIPGANPSLYIASLLGELGVGLTFGLSLMFLTESITFAATLLGMEFSFSLVNLLDPNTQVETPVLGQMLGWLSVLVILGSGLDRTLLAAVIHSFAAVPVGTAVLHLTTARALAHMASGIFLSGLQLSAPVIAAALVVEVTIGLIGKLAPQLPTQVVGIPVKTLTAYTVLLGSLAVWPTWIEHHFIALLQSAERLLVSA